MGNNALVQYVIQPILIVGVVFHFIMGFVLDYKNRKARPIAYVKNNGGANSSWFSRNMILSGSVILAFWDCIFMTSGCQKWFTNTLK
jgi:succinate dehydrogenase / fumarate reductase cytochrome b subunit